MEANPIYVISVILLKNDPSKPPPMYRVNDSIPGRPDTKISQILVVDSDVHVFARSTTDTKKGIHETLVAPTVTTIISVGPKSIQKTVIDELDSGEDVTEVIDMEGMPWRLNAAPPHDSSLTIVKMSHDDGVIEVVALPNPGSPLEPSECIILFTLMPFSFVRVAAEASLSEWLEIQQMLQDDAEEDPEEEEEEPPPPQAALPVMPRIPPPPPPPVNGAAVKPPITSEEGTPS